MLAGRVGKAHGLDGSFHVVAGKPRLLALGMTVSIEGRSCDIERSDGTDEAPILRVTGISDRVAAEAAKGLELRVDVDDLPQLGPGEWWAHELVGCVVHDGPTRVGAVVRMLELPSCEVLEVDRGDGGARLLVPMVGDAVRSVDVEAQSIDIDSGFLGETL
jgi:16S rRNA processing protein RimM